MNDEADGPAAAAGSDDDGSEGSTDGGTGRVDPGALALFHRSLAEMCRAGVPLGRAFDALGRDLELAPLSDAIREMGEAVEAGTPLDEAYRAHAGEVPPLYGALVEAGMASGDLPGALEEIARHAARAARIETRVRQALLYPLILVGLTVVVGTGLLLLIAPVYLEMLQSSREAFRGFEWGASGAPLRTRFWILGIFLGLLAAGGLVAVAVTTYRSLFGMEGILGSLPLSLRFPFVGPVRLYASLTSFLGTLAVLLRREMPLERALQLAAGASRTAPLREAVDRMREEAASGATLAESFRVAELLPPSLFWLVSAGEATGPAAALRDAAAIYEDRLERAVARMTTFVLPAAEVVVGVVVFLFAYAFLFPLVEFGHPFRLHQVGF